MIVDRIRNLDLCPISDEHLRAVRDFMDLCITSEVLPGRYPLDGDHLFALVQAYESKEMEGALMESHAVYADLQLVLQGNEMMFWAFSDELSAALDERESMDIMFYKPLMYISSIRMSPGMFAFFAPSDAHMPCIQVTPGVAEQVSKVVFKIKQD